jgi:hypothetical protein
VLTLFAIETTAHLDASAHFYWQPTVEISLDCFICCRSGRTMVVELGQEAGRCVSSRERPEQLSPEIHSYSENAFVHPAPLRIARFDGVHGNDGTNTLRCALSFWYAPFTDAKRGRPSARFSWWTRLSFGLGCRACFDAGVEGALSLPPSSTQTNMGWPVTESCRTCKRTLVTLTGPPTIIVVEPEIV